jgi:hypothetical protein
MRGFYYLALALLMGVCAGESIAATAKKSVAKKAPSKSANSTPKSQPASKSSSNSRTTSGVRKKGAAGRRAAAGKSGRPAVTWRNRQSAPTPDRYKEIQSALAAKGYLAPEQANGQWDQGSVEALRRFQADQKLDGSGKITSMSLIALGLGPTHESSLPPKPVPPDAVPPQETPPVPSAPVDHPGQ